MVIFTGKTVEEAIESGLKELGLPRLKAHIRVISREKKGFLGFGRKPAQVDIENIDEKTAHKANQKAVKGVPEEINQLNEPVTSSLEDTIELSKVTSIIKEMEAKGELEVDDEVKEQFLTNKKAPQTILEETGYIQVLEELKHHEEPDSDQPQVASVASENPSKVTADAESVAKVESDDSFEAFVAQEFKQEEAPVAYDAAEIEKVAAEVKDYVEKIIYEMDIEASLEAQSNRRHLILQIATPEAGRVIGYHGKVLKALQLLAQNFLNDRYNRYFTLSLNVNDYMEHRMETVVELAKKMAAKVLETGQASHMDPMSNLERKVVHKTISQIDGVESYSEGEEPNRHVVLVGRD